MGSTKCGGKKKRITVHKENGIYVVNWCFRHYCGGHCEAVFHYSDKITFRSLLYAHFYITTETGRLCTP
jgi:hypothetical protein